VRSVKSYYDKFRHVTLSENKYLELTDKATHSQFRSLVLALESIDT